MSVKDASSAANLPPQGSQKSGSPETQPCPDKVKVTPKLEVEYRVVLLDRRLDRYQEAGETRYPVSPTYILCSLEQKPGAPKFEGGAKLVVSGAGAVEAYEDEGLKRRVDLSSLPNGKLMGPAAPYKIYLKGTARGKFTLRLEAANPDPSRFEPEEGKDVEMGVVEVRFDLHWHDQGALENYQLKTGPDADPPSLYYDELKEIKFVQKAMSDNEKVTPGRILHAQEKGNHGRAMLRLPRLDAAEWPEGTDGYEVVLSVNRASTPDVGSDSLNLFDAEENGNGLTLPLKVKVSELKSADKILWVEGGEASKKARDVRLEAGLDRPAEGPPHKPKRHADWAGFTVVKIEEVKLVDESQQGGPSLWDEQSGRFFINLRTPESVGRRVKVSVTLSEDIPDVKVHVMLAPDKDNMKAANWGVDLPKGWIWKDIHPFLKHKDKDDRKKLLHMSGRTISGGGGKAGVTVEVLLSRFGGDKFHPAAYVGQDPHLAVYVHGDSELERRKPVFAAKAVSVWRKIWCQMIRVEGRQVPDLEKVRANLERVKVLMVRLEKDIEVPLDRVRNFSPQAVYPRYMVLRYGGNTETVVVSGVNRNQFFPDSGSFSEKDKPLKIPILVCDALFNPGKEGKGIHKNWEKASDFPIELDMSVAVLDPPLSGGTLLISGQWEAKDYDLATNSWKNPRNGMLTRGDIVIDDQRDNISHLTIKYPAGAGKLTDDTYVRITGVSVNGANGPLAGIYSIFDRHIVAAAIPWQMEIFQNALTHELGHALGQVVKAVPAGVEPHPDRIYKPEQGPHCYAVNNRCVMYESMPVPGSLGRYCDVCHPYLLIQNLDTWAWKNEGV